MERGHLSALSIDGITVVTIFYPDISSFQAGISLKGALAVACKVTQGTTYANPDYNRARSNAAVNGTFFFAYHFLTHGSAASQAVWCHSKAGSTPLMVDFEPSGTSRPGVSDCLVFIDTYRKLGGVIHLVYLPRWYWSQLGNPSLAGLESRGMKLVSSQYTGYGDKGPGWDSYGGANPAIWQYTDSVRFNGFNVDFNAFKGTLAELKSIVKTGKYPAPPPPPPTTDNAGNPVRNLKVDPRWTQADVSWSPSKGATQYRVNLWAHFPRRRIQKLDTKSTEVTFTNLRKGSRYTVTILAEPASVRFRLGPGRASKRFDTKK